MTSSLPFPFNAYVSGVFSVVCAHKVPAIFSNQPSPIPESTWCHDFPAFTRRRIFGNVFTVHDDTIFGICVFDPLSEVVLDAGSDLHPPQPGAPPSHDVTSHPRLGYLSCSSGINSGPGGNQTGNAGWSGAGHASRDYSAEGAGDRYFGLHLAIPTDQLSATLQRLVQEDGSLLEPLPLCHIPVNPAYRGLTKGRGRFGLDSQGRVVGGVHNSNKPNVCVSGATIPVTTKEAPFKVPAFAVGPLRAGKVITRNQSNANALKKSKKN